jgi:hypothetical protein
MGSGRDIRRPAAAAAGPAALGQPRDGGATTGAFSRSSTLRDRRHGHAELLDPPGEVAPQPFRHAPRQRRDDHLVEARILQRGPDRLERVHLAGDALDRSLGRALEERHGGVERPVRAALARLVGDQQDEGGGAFARAPAYGLEEQRRRRRPVGHRQDPAGARFHQSASRTPVLGKPTRRWISGDFWFGS